MSLSKLAEVVSSKTRTSTTTTTSSETTKKKEVPKGAKIINKTVRTETEEIENGWIISKNYDVSYEVNGSRDYAYYSKKWYSKTNPVAVKITNKALADQFEEED